MSRKYILSFLFLFIGMFGWQAFLIHRDDQLFKAYYRHQAMENLKQPPSNQIR